MSRSTDDHRRAASDRTARCAVLTISDSRTPQNDSGGDRIVAALLGDGHSVVDRRIVRDDPAAIAEALETWVRRGDIDAVCTTGGTGISTRDTTFEVVDRMLDKRLDGFGELFRMLSWEQVGSAAMLSRAVAGLCGETLVFTIPGSPDAVSLAMTRLIVPELRHLIWERRR